MFNNYSSSDESDEQSGEQYIIKVITQPEVEHIRTLLLRIGVKNFSELPPSINEINKFPTIHNPFWFVILCNDEQYKILVREKVNIILDYATLSTCD